MQELPRVISGTMWKMASRTALIVANWKMNCAPIDKKAYKPRTEVDIVVFPTFLDIATCIADRLVVGAQYGHPNENGAHTGDISMKMLKDAGCTYVLCGHSERRQGHGETDAFVASQVFAARKIGLHPILCVGETAEERRTGREKVVVEQQLKAVLEHPDFCLPRPACPAEAKRRGEQSRGVPSDFCIAYEPVWAIGTGNTATPEDAQEMHAFIRKLLTAHSSLTFAKASGGKQLTASRILYGGSMKPENAETILNQPDVDGGLVGGASLDPQHFSSIVDAAVFVSNSR